MNEQNSYKKKIKEKMNEQKETSRPIILEKNKQNKSGDEL